MGLKRGTGFKLYLAMGLCLLASGISFGWPDNSSQQAAPQTFSPRPVPYEIVSAQPSSNAVYAGRFPGADISQKINAADVWLGERAGEIVAEGGGTIGTQIVVGSHHTLRLRAGIYAPTTATVPILLKSGSRLVGDGWSKTIILESSVPTQWGIVNAYGFNHDQLSIDTDIEVRNCQFKGVPKPFNSAPPTVILGNCHDCLIDGNFLNGTHSIGVQFGAQSSPTVYAENCTASNNYFSRVASQNLAVVNGKNITFSHNLFLQPSQKGGPFVAVIDAEVNSCGTDYLDNIQIVDNYLDIKESDQPGSIGFIAFQPCSERGSGRISGNIMVAGEPGYVSYGVFLNPQAHDLEIDHNYIKGAVNAALILTGPRLYVHDNVIIDSGGGGSVAVQVDNVFDSRFINNTIVNPTFGLSAISERFTSDRNTYEGNRVRAITLTGRASKIISNNTNPSLPPRPAWVAAPVIRQRQTRQ